MSLHYQATPLCPVYTAGEKRCRKTLNHYYYHYCSLLCHVNGGQERAGTAKKNNNNKKSPVSESVDYMWEQDMGGAEDANKSGGHFCWPAIFQKSTAVRKVDLRLIRHQRLLPSQTLCCLSHTNAPRPILCVLHRDLIKIFHVLFLLPHQRCRWPTPLDWTWLRSSFWRALCAPVVVTNTYSPAHLEGKFHVQIR